MIKFSTAVLLVVFSVSLPGQQPPPAPRPAAPNTPAPNPPVADPGPRQGPPAAGSVLSGLAANLPALFNQASLTFAEVDSVSGTLPGETDSGLGPSFNMNSCAGCHAYPAMGGSSPQLNPQVAVATLDGAQNTLPSFITSSGPVREVRFRNNADGTADGGVHDLFTITGRIDAPAGCNLAQTDFAPQLAAGNLSFRIPVPLFGAGLIESIPDAAILANQDSNLTAKSTFGITGHANLSGNDGTITRFGWKAQNKSLLMFAGEAYSVEQGVTNELFPNSRQTSSTCDSNPVPEDTTDLNTGAPSDIVNFAMFMRLLAPPQAVGSYNDIPVSSVQNGHSQFIQAGCVLCHTESMTTASSPIPALSSQTARLFSDLLVHHMGSGLADGIAQGTAAGDEFRTAPLWGLGQRLFFLHDGRASDLIEAIQAHAGPGSEANASVNAFNALSGENMQDLLNFLRSL